MTDLTATRRGGGMRGWLLPMLIVLGILGLHHVITTPDVHDLFSGTVVSADATVPVDVTAAPATGTTDGEASGLVAECGGLLLLCLAMLVGFGAIAAMRGRPHGGVLWVAPFARSAEPPAWKPPLSTDLLARTGLLRC